jgi:hypothetical protein
MSIFRRGGPYRWCNVRMIMCRLALGVAWLTVTAGLFLVLDLYT